jgi:two-component system, NtrC family, response regulator AtoC
MGQRQVLNQSKLASGTRDLPPEEVIFGQSFAMQTIRNKILRVASTDVPLLIEGENGTGKEVLARLVHARSACCDGPFAKVNCAAIPGTLIESELFGYEKGAFTGAYTSKPGRVEMANGGTLFLDEIAELELSVQAKLLQFLQDGEFSRIGDYGEKHVAARVICATSRKLEEEIEAGRFRRDLFYRINVIHIKLPPLRDRRADIPSLADYFLAASNAQFQRTAPGLPREIIDLLQRRDWPGNIRELENCMARCVILGAEDALESYLSERRPPGSKLTETGEDGSLPLKRVADKARRELERSVILKTLETYNWNRRKTAEALRISYRTLLYKVREAGFPSMRERKKFDLESDGAPISGASFR